MFYEQELRESAVSAGSKTPSKKLLKEMNFDLPLIDTQLETMKRTRPVLALRKSAAEIIRGIDRLTTRQLVRSNGSGRQKETN